MLNYRFTLNCSEMYISSLVFLLIIIKYPSLEKSMKCSDGDMNVCNKSIYWWYETPYISSQPKSL